MHRFQEEKIRLSDNVYEAREYQREAPILGGAIGSALGLGIAAWLGRWGRK